MIMYALEHSLNNLKYLSMKNSIMFYLITVMSETINIH